MSLRRSQGTGECGAGERAKVVVLERFWVALMLRSIIFESPIRQVCEAFRVARGTLQVLLPDCVLHAPRPPHTQYIHTPTQSTYPHVRGEPVLKHARVFVCMCITGAGTESASIGVDAAWRSGFFALRIQFFCGPFLV